MEDNNHGKKVGAVVIPSSLGEVCSMIGESNVPTPDMTVLRLFLLLLLFKISCSLVHMFLTLLLKPIIHSYCVSTSSEIILLACI